MWDMELSSPCCLLTSETHASVKNVSAYKYFTLTSFLQWGNMKTRAFTRRPVAQAISLVLGSTVVGSLALSQEANQGAGQNLDEIVVTGIRGSLTSSMNLKREAQGVVDGIVAEDIGKFPDTNLAESLQRITGVSID